MNGKLKTDKSFDRIFPSQDSIRGGYGNLIAVPFHGEAVPKGNSLFVDPETTEPYTDQLDLLLNVRRATEDDFDRYIERYKLSRMAELVKSRISGNVSRAYDVAQLGELEDLKHCKFIQYADEHRTDLPEPLWWVLADNLSAYGEDGREFFHAWSEGYPGYDPKEADAKFDQCLKRRESGYSPVGCKKMREMGFSCPMLDKCSARVVANFPAVYSDLPMDLSEMQEYTHVIGTTHESESQFRRFALGWQQLDDELRLEVLEQVAESCGWDNERKKRFVQ